MPPLQSSFTLHSSHPQLSLLSGCPLRRRIFFPQTLTLKRHPVSCHRSNYFEQQSVPPRSPEQMSFASQSNGNHSYRVYAGYSIYKGKAALSVEPRPPEFSLVDVSSLLSSGPLTAVVSVYSFSRESGAFKVSKEGFILLQLAPAVGTRQYDWSRKQIFSLSVGEIGILMGLGAKDACEFFHDPFKGRSEEGKIRKFLKVDPLPDGSGHFFNLNVQNRLLNVDESIYIPITRAELIILNSAFNFILPYLMGWHALAETINPEDSIKSNFTSQRPVPELEWGR